jgi:FSR family fosmidomycin resistance protein-like MFS transporter
LLDELVYGTREAAWPLIRHDLGLSYAQVALVIAVPGYFALLVEPVLGVLADRGRRRALILAGGALFVATTVLFGLVPGFAALLVVEIVAAPSSGAFVALSQAALMDESPSEREQAMACWTLAGSLGVVIAPLLVVGSIAVGGGWREVFVGLGVVGAAVLLLARPFPLATAAADEHVWATVRTTVGLLRRRDVLRWLLVLQVTDLMLDVLHGFLALYLVDVARASPSAAALAVSVWTGAGLVGDAALLVVLRRVSGLGFLRSSALLVAVVYPAFLLAPGLPAKVVALAFLGLLNAGWYALPKAQLYDAVGERSGAVLALGTLAGAIGSTLPLAIGLLAGTVGLGVALWIALAALLLLLFVLPRGGATEVDGTRC